MDIPNKFSLTPGPPARRYNVVKLTYTRACNGEHRTVIASVKAYTPKFHLMEFGHPYDIDKEYMFAGGMGLDTSMDTIIFAPCTDNEYSIWLNSYQKFHEEIMKEKGYDACEE